MTPRPLNPARSTPITGVPELLRDDDRQNIAGVFVQDDYKVSSTLTVNLGLRWNYFGAMYDKQNNLSVFTPGAGAAMLTGASLVQTGSLATSQKGNFGPQVGFAWSSELLQPEGGRPRRLRHQLRREPDCHYPLRGRERAERDLLRAHLDIQPADFVQHCAEHQLSVRLSAQS